MGWQSDTIITQELTCETWEQKEATKETIQPPLYNFLADFSSCRESFIEKKKKVVISISLFQHCQKFKHTQCGRNSEKQLIPLLQVIF